MELPVGVWGHYGFSSSPYSTSALQVAGADETLLVGRDQELRTVLRDLISGTQMVALEGDYGVGKSSLAAVAASTASRWRQARDSIAPLFLAPGRPLELEEKDTASSLERRAYFQVAGSILANEDRLIREGINLTQLNEFRYWLTTPTGGGWSAGIGASFPAVIGTNLSIGRTRSSNTSTGFTESGVITLIDSWLAAIFVTPEAGGVILLLDNLEVLSRFTKGVQLFESLRDRLFKRQGLRWIISGAEGTVRAALSTPKMSGVFPEPIDIAPLPHDLVKLVIARREEAFRVRSDAKLPVSPSAFEDAYAATGRNLRIALGLAERFSLRTEPGDMAWMTPEERDARFWAWTVNEGEKVIKQISDKVTDKQWKVLTTLVTDLDGFATSANAGDFGYKSLSSFQAHVQALAALRLVNYTADEQDGRRRIITATETGRLAVASRPSSSVPGK
ncbi:hypothetical protein ACIPY5_14975 [Microbacterium sp. NPDC089698]|uniref:hypothetical protein n=1 Tax=Microbacterium sp. NPDC089698 TaxID=3364200 RepID=UPI00382F045D